MAPPPTVDRFSALPDSLIVTILCLLPTHVAARTSVLSRRFRDLSKNSPSLELNSREMPLPRAENFLAAADRLILSRDVNSYPLRSLHLDISELSVSKHGSFFSSLFVKLCTSGLRHLAVQGQDLSVKVSCMSMLSIASNTIRKFNMLLVAGYHLDTVMLSLPLLEVFRLEPGRLLFKLPHQLPQFQGEIPLLRKAVLKIDCVRKEDCGRVIRLMNYVSHVQELVLDVKEDESEKDPFLILLDSGKEVPNFPNLKHLEVTMCFCDHNLRAVISMLHHSPALESVKLVHEIPKMRRRTEDWENRLWHNTDSNHSCWTFRDLHLGANGSNFLKYLTERCDPKSQA